MPVQCQEQPPRASRRLEAHVIVLALLAACVSARSSGAFPDFPAELSEALDAQMHRVSRAASADALDMHADVLCVGDSLTAGYHCAARASRRAATREPRDPLLPYAAALQGALQPARVQPLGFCGFTSRSYLDAAHARLPRREAPFLLPFGAGDTLPGLHPAVDDFAPSVAVVLFGTNDILHKHTAQDLNGTAIAARIFEIHSALHERGVRTVAVGVPEFSPGYHSTKDKKSLRGEIMRLRRQARRDANAELKRYADAQAANMTYTDFPVRYAESGHDALNWCHDGYHMTAAGYTLLGQRLAKPVRAMLLRHGQPRRTDLV